MSIKIISEPDVKVTREELARYTYEYSQAYRMYAGPIPTLEEYIRRQQKIEKTKIYSEGSHWRGDR
jgi:hypothetical protein